MLGVAQVPSCRSCKTVELEHYSFSQTRSDAHSTFQTTCCRRRMHTDLRQDSACGGGRMCIPRQDSAQHVDVASVFVS